MRELWTKLARLQILQSPIARNIYTVSRQRVIVPHFDTKFNDTIKRIAEHPANNHLFLQYIETKSEEGFTGLQLSEFRDFFLTINRIHLKLTLLALIRAIKEENNHAMVEIGANLAEESGAYGTPDKTHPQMLKDSFNTFCKIVFGLPPISLADATNPKNMLQAVADYHRMQKLIYSDRSSWATIAGCMYAHEKLAHPMLVDIFDNIFKPFEGYFAKYPEQWKTVCAYFDAHIKVDESGVSIEEQHGKSALEVIKKIAIENPKALEQIENGAMAFLDATFALWNAALEQMIENEKYGMVVPPKPVKNLERETRSQVKPNPSTTEPRADTVVNKPISKSLTH
jgi:hypothetical protein